MVSWCFQIKNGARLSACRSAWSVGGRVVGCLVKKWVEYEKMSKNVEKWYRNVVVTQQPSEHYYLSHATFPFPCDRFLCLTVVYSRFVAFWAILWLLSNYCVAIPCLKLMMVTWQLTVVYMRLEKVSKGPALVVLINKLSHNHTFQTIVGSRRTIVLKIMTTIRRWLLLFFSLNSNIR
jgi:hypothetical protein